MSAILRSIGEKSKLLARRVLANRELFPAILLISVGVVSFGLGRLSGQSVGVLSQERLSENNIAQLPVLDNVERVEKEDMLSTSDNVGSETSTQQPAMSASGRDVASKNGTKYHLPWCSGAARIAEENKIWFASKKEAAVAGYTPAANCKGI